MDVRIKVEGFRELEAALKELGDKAARRVARAAMKKAAEPIRAAAAAGAPRSDKPSHTEGRLADNIITSVSIKKDGVHAFIGPDRKIWWGHFTEFGTSHHSAHPYMRPALDQRGGQALQILKDELGSGIEKEAAKAARIRVRTG